jgi:hypothetical protein
VNTRCPYCGNHVDTTQCDIVIRKYNPQYDPKDSGDDLSKSVYVLLEKPAGRQHGAVTPNESKGERYRCHNCGAPLPAGFPALETVVMAVVGLNRAGKTYFIGTSLPKATTSDSISKYFDGYIKDFESIEETDRILQKEYVLNEKFEANPELGQKIPLLFRVTLQSGGRFNLLVYDLPGEWYVSHGLNQTDGGFIDCLQWADAVLFLADPTAVKDILKTSYISDDKKKWLTDNDIIYQRENSQVQLLRHIKETVFHQPGRNMRQHLAIVVTKADLIFESADTLLDEIGMGSHEHGSQADTAYFQAMQDYTVKFLNDTDQGRIVTLADELPHSSFHIVSAGRIADANSRDANRQNIVMEPHFVLDPWVAAIRALTLPRNLPTINQNGDSAH